MHILPPTHIPESSFRVPLTSDLQEDYCEEAEREDKSEASSSEIHVKVELVDPDKVATNEAKFRMELSEVTLKTVSEVEVNLDAIQIFSESVHADLLKVTGMREALQ